MESAIRKLYYGDFGRGDMIKASDQYDELLQNIVDYDDALIKFFKKHPVESEKFKKLKDFLDDLNAQQAVDYYKHGFRNGFLLALDVLSDD